MKYLALICFLSTFNIQADFDRRHMFITGQVSGVTASGDEIDRLDDNGLDIYNGLVLKPEIRFGAQIKQHLSIAGSVSYHKDSDQSTILAQTTETDLSFLNLTFEGNYHVNGFNSFYFGGHFGFSSADREEKISNVLTTDEDTNAIYGLQFGYNFPMGERLSLGLRAQFSFTTFDDDDYTFSSLGFNGSFFF